MAGKIFTREEASKLFGCVSESISMDIDKFNSILENTEKNIMFKILNNKLFILGDDRRVLYPPTTSVTKEEVFARADKSIVVELISRSESTKVEVEKRETCTTVSYGDYTLEELVGCPPNCY